MKGKKLFVLLILPLILFVIILFFYRDHLLQRKIKSCQELGIPGYTLNITLNVDTSDIYSIQIYSGNGPWPGRNYEEFSRQEFSLDYMNGEKIPDAHFIIEKKLILRQFNFAYMKVTILYIHQ